MPNPIERGIEFAKKNPQVAIIAAGGVLVLVMLKRKGGTAGAPVDFGSVVYQMPGTSGGGGGGGGGSPAPVPTPRPIPKPGPVPSPYPPGPDPYDTDPPPPHPLPRPVSCPPGTVLINGTCQNISVPPVGGGGLPGFWWNKPANEGGPPGPYECGPGWHYNGLRCVPDDDTEGVAALTNLWGLHVD